MCCTVYNGETVFPGEKTIESPKKLKMITCVKKNRHSPFPRLRFDFLIILGAKKADLTGENTRNPDTKSSTPIFFQINPKLMRKTEIDLIRKLRVIPRRIYRADSNIVTTSLFGMFATHVETCNDVSGNLLLETNSCAQPVGQLL